MGASFLFSIIGTVTFAGGIAALIAELMRSGLSRLSLVSYLCFLASTVFLSGSIAMLAVSAGGLSALFLILLLCYRREKRQIKQNLRENPEDKI